MDGLMRHVASAKALRLPGPFVAWRAGGVVLGYVPPATAALLAPHGLLDAPDMDGAGRAATILREMGLWKPRGELFDIRATPGGAALGTIDRGALPALGLRAEGTHVNGLVRHGESWRLWVAHRAANRPLDGGKLDHVVAGGIAAGSTPRATLIKEAAEEAGMPAALAAQARAAGTLSYAMARPEGLRRDTLHCFDLELPADFVPRPQDAEVARFELMDIRDVHRLVAETDAFKFNVSFVLIGLFARLGMPDAIAAWRALQDAARQAEAV